MTHKKLLRSPLAASAIALTLILSACGSSSEEAEGETPEPAAADAAEDTTEETGAAVVAADGQPVALGEWFIEIDGDVASGATTFALSNNGENPHALAVAVGDAYENLPQLENGAVDTEALGADFIGSSENTVAGGVGQVEFDLAAGDYVFFCPINFGPNSHARAGQVLSVTVS